ncbi:MAG: gliding motility protein GldL [Bacteroidetes bacterium HGW-Bacteroidetes-11]|jgi:gliding motility-associated protein GldL|nr:MAG: gliding motility protein GldL [Bacteroidetes bacterium HGW-Bacteroidetes-11]
MGLNNLVRGKGFRNFMSKLYGIGAAVVILGALFKINHYPFANEMLIVGLGTEALIFFFSAFEPPHVEPDWSLVYPELAGMYHGGAEITKGGKTPTQELDNMLEKAKIGPELIQSLGNGLRSLSENASKMSDLSSAAVATNDYTRNLGNAAKSVNELSLNVAKANESTSQLTSAYQLTAQSLAKSVEKFDFSGLDNRTYSEQLQKIGNNLSALNAVYELQLKNSNAHLEDTSKLHTSINQYLSTLTGSSEDMGKYRLELDALTKKVAALNNVYGNMLAAMNVK